MDYVDTTGRTFPRNSNSVRQEWGYALLSVLPIIASFFIYAIGRRRPVQNEGHETEQRPIPAQPNPRRRTRRGYGVSAPEQLESLAFHIEWNQNNAIEDVRPYGPVCDLSELSLKVNQKSFIAVQKWK